MNPDEFPYFDYDAVKVPIYCKHCGRRLETTRHAGYDEYTGNPITIPVPGYCASAICPGKQQHYRTTER